jgi:hypothetical protein
VPQQIRRSLVAARFAGVVGRLGAQVVEPHLADLGGQLRVG